MDIQLAAVSQDIVDSPNLIVQVFFLILSFLDPPPVQEFPHIILIITAQSPVLKSSFILTQEQIQSVLFLVELFPGKFPERFSQIKIIPGIFLLLYKILIFRKVQIFYRVFICQIDHKRVTQLLIKILLDSLKSIGKILLFTKRHGRKTFPIIFHQPEQGFLFPYGITDIIEFLPDKTFQKNTVTGVVFTHVIVGQHHRTVFHCDFLKFQVHDFFLLKFLILSDFRSS